MINTPCSSRCPADSTERGATRPATFSHAVACGFTELGLHVLLLPIIFAVAPGDVRAQGIPFYLVQVHHSGRTAEVLVNDIPVSTADTDLATMISQVSPFMVDGMNSVTVRWGEASGMRPLEVALMERLPSGAVLEREGIEVTGNEAGEWSIDVEMSMPEDWSLSRAAEIDALDVSDREAIISTVRKLHADMGAGRVDELVGTLELMLRENALNRPGSVARVRSGYKRIMSDVGWAVRPLDPSALRLEVVGRLVRVTTDGPVIESEPFGDGGSSTLRLETLYFAVIDGRWVLVRRT